MSKRILMVDDSETLRSFMKVPLVNAGYEIIEAGDGLEAFGKLEVETFDLLITDLNMPELNGMELITKMRNDLPSCKFLPALMLTTEIGTDLKERAKEIGITAWLTKPFNPDKLLTVVQKVLR
jgi:two-component system, chemotaxis family, chemotaxis protein CheY